MICPSCHVPALGTDCPSCGATFDKRKGWEWAMTAEPKLPKWQAKDVVYCKKCDLVVSKAKAKSDGGFLGDPGYFCPACEEKLADLDSVTP